MKEIIDFKYMDIGKDPLNDLHHSHGASYEILFVRKGCGNIVVRNQLFALREGAIYFINGMDTHCSVPEDPNKYERSKIIITSGLIDKFADAANCREIVRTLFSGGSCFLPNEAEAAYIDEQFRAIERTLTEDSRFTAVGVTLCIMSIMFAGYKKNADELLTEDSRLSDILNYINKNLSGKITLDDICKHCHLSKYYLCHEFKKNIGMSVFDYILSRRLTVAKRYLSESNKSISEIASDTGFGDFSYFSKLFKKHYGLTPTEFRNNNTE